MLPSLEKRKGPAILVVDDDLNEMRSMVIGLRLEGFDAEGANSGLKAIEMMSSRTYSAVVIDLMMPEMNGLQLARNVRSSFPGIPTILMSAYHLSPVQLARADTGVVGFVPKPFSFDDFVRFLQQKIDPSLAIDSRSLKEEEDTGLHPPIDIPGIVTDISVPRGRRDSSEILPPK
jgi:DNA-binding NtrC family response regulator